MSLLDVIWNNRAMGDASFISLVLLLVFLAFSGLWAFPFFSNFDLRVGPSELDLSLAFLGVLDWLFDPPLLGVDADLPLVPDPNFFLTGVVGGDFGSSAGGPAMVVFVSALGFKFSVVVLSFRWFSGQFCSRVVAQSEPQF